MKKIFKLVLAIFVFTSIVGGVNDSAFAEDNDENEESINEMKTLPSDHVFTLMDEEGNIVEDTHVEDSGIVQSDGKKAKVAYVTNGVVNFKTKNATENTLYTEAITNRSGYTNGSYGADGAYLEHSADGSMVKFMQAGVIGWVSAADVQVLDFANPNIKSSSYYTINGANQIVHYITTNMTSNSMNALNVGKKPAYLKQGVKYYSYDGHYFYSDERNNGYATMISDYRNETRANSVNSKDPYYNYFQFLPHRSKSNFSGAELDWISINEISGASKMKDVGGSFEKYQNAFGINALLMYGVAVNESAWGKSSIAMNKNNIFGHAAYDSDPSGSSNSYSSVDFSIYYHASGFLSNGYCNPNDWRYFGSHLGDKSSGINVKYASDPFWGEKAASIAWIINNTYGSQDEYWYTIGVKDTVSHQHTDLNIRKEATTNSNTLFRTGLQSNQPFIIREETNGFYKIQSDGTLSGDRNSLTTGQYYSFGNDYAYAHASYLTKVSTGHGVSLDGIVWINRETGIDVGVSYFGGSNSQFKWQAYNLDVGTWTTISDWKTGNWSTWKPTTGNYWLYVEAKASDGQIRSEIINFRVDKDYSADYLTSLKGALWSASESQINLSANYASNDPNLQFKWQSYNVDTQQWKTISDWKRDSSTVWKPMTGNYWIHIEARQSNGVILSNTSSFRADKDYGTDYSTSLNGLTWLYKDAGIDVGVSYASNDPNLKFKWQAYNLDTQTWTTISDWKTGNWSTWRPTKGNYWLHVEAKGTDGTIVEKTIAFNIDKDYIDNYTTTLNGMTWIYRDTGIDVGVSYTSNDPNLKFKWQAYNLDTQTWTTISDWKAGNWSTWNPKAGNYWLYVEARQANGQVSTEIINFRVDRNY